MTRNFEIIVYTALLYGLGIHINAIRSSDDYFDNKHPPKRFVRDFDDALSTKRNLSGPEFL